MPRTSGPGSQFVFNYSFLGDAWNGEANLNGTLSGVESPFVNCTVTLNGSGNTGANLTTGNGASRNGNGDLATGIDFTGGNCSNANLNLSLTLACTCA